MSGSLEIARASLLVRLAQELARATDELTVAQGAVEELDQLSGTDAVALYCTTPADQGPKLLAHAGRGTRASWERPPTIVRAALRAGSEIWAADLDLARLRAVGVESDQALVVPLTCDDELLGALVVASERGAVLDRLTTTTAAGLIGAVLSTLRRLAVSADEARRDPLTGLPNKRAFRELVTRLLGPGRPASSTASLVLLDIDDFKKINDTRGHPAGDRVLRQVSRVILRALRADEEAFRIGGEEFAVVVDGDAAAAARVAERVRSALAESTRESLPTISAGVAETTAGLGDIDELVGKADAALYEAKAAGKNRVVIAGRPAVAVDTRPRPRPGAVLRAVALAELPHVASSWHAAETTRVGQAAFVVACRHLASTVGAAGASVSLIEGERLARQAIWLDAQLRPLARRPAPILTRAAAVPLAGAPRVLRTAAAGSLAADVVRLRALGAQSALIAGLVVDGTLVGAVEVYDTRSNAFLAAEVQRVMLASRELAALVVERTHADALRRQYRSNVISLCSVVRGDGSARAELELAACLARAVAEGCGRPPASAFACELATLAVLATEVDETLHAEVEEQLAALPFGVAARIVRELRGRPERGSAPSQLRETALVETVLAYVASVRRHQARGEDVLGALSELVDDTSAGRPPCAIEALIRTVEGTRAAAGGGPSEPARRVEDGVEVGELRGLVAPRGDDASVVADQER